QDAGLEQPGFQVLVRGIVHGGILQLRMSVTFGDIAAAHERIKPHAVRTPVLSSAAVDERIGARVFFKCENLQNMGAFKFRGAFNALSLLDQEERKRGVLAYSS